MEEVMKPLMYEKAKDHKEKQCSQQKKCPFLQPVCYALKSVINFSLNFLLNLCCVEILKMEKFIDKSFRFLCL